MNPVTNPYSPGAGTPPPALVGRDAQLTDFDVALRRLLAKRNAKSMMLTGLRGVGKTVLLNEFGRRAEGLGYLHEHYEASEDVDLPRAVAVMARKALLKLSTGRKAAAIARRSLGVLKAFTLRLPDGPEFTIDVDAVTGPADSGDLADDLAGLFTEMGRLAAEHNRGVLFTVDEIQYVSAEHLEAVIIGLHRVAQHQLPLMLAAAGLPSLPALAGEAKSYSERLFAFPQIGRLPDVDAEAALQQPAHAEGVSWNEHAINKVVEQSQGYPYFLQEFGKQAWDAAIGPTEILRPDVDSSIPVALAELDSGFFRVRIDRATDNERSYLRAMSELGPGPHGSGDVAKELKKTTTQLGPVRDGLIKKGLIYSPRWGQIAFTVPLFDEFMKRWIP